MDRKKACEAKGWIWNEKTKTCTMPKIGIVKFSAPRGPGCDGSTNRKTTGDALKLATKKDLLRAAAKLRSRKPAAR
jgi:hypothetical protein